jgi:hypothetical protein
VTPTTTAVVSIIAAIWSAPLATVPVVIIHAAMVLVSVAASGIGVLIGPIAFAGCCLGSASAPALRLAAGRLTGVG